MWVHSTRKGSGASGHPMSAAKAPSLRSHSAAASGSPHVVEALFDI